MYRTNIYCYFFYFTFIFYFFGQISTPRLLQPWTSNKIKLKNCSHRGLPPSSALPERLLERSDVEGVGGAVGLAGVVGGGRKYCTYMPNKTARFVAMDDFTRLQIDI